MDTSKEYIKMCEGAEEIQKLKEELKDGDFFAVAHYQSTHKYYGKYVTCEQCDWEYEGGPRKERGHVWLPRQDQLQEMVKELLSDSPIHNMGRFNRQIHANPAQTNYVYYCKFKSMEQLWLAFVMKEKYHKIWNGQNWMESE